MMAELSEGGSGLVSELLSVLASAEKSAVEKARAMAESLGGSSATVSAVGLELHSAPAMATR